MTHLQRLTLTIMAAAVAAHAADPNLVKLIGTDSRLVCGMDVARFRNSALGGLDPSGLDWISTASRMSEIKQVVIVMRDPAGNGQPLLIVSGTGAAADTEDAERRLRVDEHTVLLGDRDSLGDAVRRLNSGAATSSALAESAQLLRDSYDLWLLAVKPLDWERGPAPGVLKYRDELVREVEEARGGIRLGLMNDVRAEVQLHSADGANAVAAIGKFLPGLLQFKGAPNDPMTMLVGLAENLSVRAEGTTAVFTFSIPDQALKELAQKKTVVE